MLAHSDSCKPKKNIKGLCKMTADLQKEEHTQKKKITSNKHNSGADGLK